MDKLGAISTVSVQPSPASSAAVGSAMQIGDQISGQVLDSKNGQFTLSINGQTITAESAVPLNPGDLLQLEFQGLNEGLLTLRLLTVNRNLAFTPLTFEDLAAQLANLKLPVNETTAELAKSMAEFGVPLTKENIQELLLALQGKEPNDATMQAASFLKNAEIPVTPENLSALSNFFQSKPELGSYLAQLQNFAVFSGNDGRIGQLLAMLPGVLGEYLLDPKATKKKNLDKIEQLAGFAGVKKKDSPDGLKSLLSELRQEIEQNGASGKKGNLESLSLTLTRLEGLVRGEHLLNADNRSDSFLYFQVPMNFSGEKVTAQIRIQYEKDENGKRIVNPEKTRVEFAVTTPSMGTVHCNLDVLKRKVAAKLFVDESRENFVQGNLNLLKESMEKLDYRMTSVKVSSEPQDFWPMPKVEWKSLERVNVRV